MEKHLVFSFIGGDMRQLQTISSLAKDGYIVKVFGFDYDFESRVGSKNVYVAKSVGDCLCGCDVVVLPVPFSVDGKRINTPLTKTEISIDGVFGNIGDVKVVFGGKMSEKSVNQYKNSQTVFCDYAARPEFEVMNAVPTAEGAVEVAMKNVPITIHGSKCLVIGYGKIGKILSADLKGLCADVTATSRNADTLAEIRSLGYASLSTYDIRKCIEKFDIVFNTVPKTVLDLPTLAETKEDVLIIDLASSPGGVDFKEAEKLGRKVIHALSLPGKVAPVTAGEIIKETIMNVLQEMEV